MAALGCLVIGGSAFSVYELAWPFAVAYDSWLAGIVFYAGLNGVGLFIGLALLVSAYGCRTSSRPPRLRLWAKLVIVLGLAMIIDFPLMAYGTLLFQAMVGNVPIGSYEYPNIFDSSLLELSVRMMVAPIVLGIIAVGVAVIWGRLKPMPDVTSVFN